MPSNPTYHCTRPDSSKPLVWGLQSASTNLPTKSSEYHPAENLWFNPGLGAMISKEKNRYIIPNHFDNNLQMFDQYSNAKQGAIIKLHLANLLPSLRSIRIPESTCNVTIITQPGDNITCPGTWNFGRDGHPSSSLSRDMFAKAMYAATLRSWNRISRTDIFFVGKLKGIQFIHQFYYWEGHGRLNYYHMLLDIWIVPHSQTMILDLGLFS